MAQRTDADCVVTNRCLIFL